ncbi:hypothetical protein CTM93_20160 [Photobacterium phosphoreum]|uniref:DUF2971 domain-containing protein n=1 Tax=Photobacterium phosphoreum TaxID=659 RepID=UPI000D183B04|nr:DUF2971 domain-containing protein [Photobacterium phosphoreum]PSU74735.1 hypothetical protein CTM93_20160 [Photobacterium phosphoreum]
MFKNCLFRYRQYNEFTLKEILYNELWHSTVKGLNDPFEFPFFFNRDYKYEEAQVWYLLDKLEVRSMEDIIEYRENKTKSLPILIKFLDDFIDNLEIDIRKDILESNVCCFSKKDRDSLMWSHYADGMRGLCIVYDKSSLHDSGVKLCDVEYTKSVIKTNIEDLKVKPKNRYAIKRYEATFSTTFDEIYKFSYFKHLNWKYEKETRSIITNKHNDFSPDGQIVKIKNDAIRAVIIGNKMQQSNKDIVKMICRTKNIPIFDAEPNLKNFSILYKETT